MIKGYLLKRESIIKLILDSDKTKEGNYYCPFFEKINELSGNIKDINYYYNRSVFKNKVYFTEKDVELYSSNKEVKNFDIDDYRILSNKFYDIYEQIKSLDLKEKIPKEENTLEDVIDTFIYFYDIK